MKAKLLLTIMLICSLNCLLRADTVNATKLLQKGWSEYQLGEYGHAEQLFKQALRQAGDDSKNYSQAVTGIAFCYQYAHKQQATVGDYSYALKLYQQAMRKLGKQSPYYPFFTAMSAECLFKRYTLNHRQADLKQAIKLWNSIQQHWRGTVVAQDALLYQVMALTGDDYSTPEARQMAQQLESYLKEEKIIPISDKRQRSAAGKQQLLAAVMCNYLGDFYFWRHNYRRAIDWLINYYRLGASSYSYKADALFKIARIADLKLKDYPLAVKYYRLFHREIKSDKRRYFVAQRISQLNKDIKK